MTQVFADDDQVAAAGMLTYPGYIPMQPTGRRSDCPPTEIPPAPSAPALSSALTPGKGVRRIRCIGCSHDTLPRNDDGAPLCHRCSELLAGAVMGPGLPGALNSQSIFRTPRWLRRRSAFD